MESPATRNLLEGKYRHSPDASSLLLFSMAEFWPVIRRLVAARNPQTIVEIGVEGGVFGDKLMEYCAASGASYIGIDPSLAVEKQESIRAKGGHLLLQPSLDALRDLPIADIYFIDGDHNYFTVFGEMQRILSAAGQCGSSPLVFLHDTSWPCDRRDFYYRIDGIPQADQQPSVFEPAVVPGNASIAVDGFTLKGVHAAETQGGPRNGVLTAVEDVLRQHPDWQVCCIPAVFGLGIVWQPGASTEETNEEMRRIQDGLQVFGSLVSRMEENRVHLYTSLLHSEELHSTQNLDRNYQLLYREECAKKRWGATTICRILIVIRAFAKSILAMRLGCNTSRVRTPELIRGLIRSSRELCLVDTKARVLVFDMFDTLVCRDVDPPDAVIEQAMDYAWLLLMRNGLELQRETVRQARCLAARQLRARMEMKGIDPECTLVEILDETWRLLKCGAIGKYLTAEVARFELECELATIRAMPGAAEVLAEAKRLGKTVVIASDTYLSGHDLDRILQSVGLGACIDHVFTSADHRKGKYSGGLFRVISQALNVPLDAMSHIGDNFHSDYIVPKRLGIKSQWMWNPTEYRRRWKAHSLAFSSTKCAVFRRHFRDESHYRQQVKTTPLETKDEKVLYRLGWDVFGPLFHSFMEQAAARVAGLGVTDVYFLARDGFGFVELFENLWKALPGVNRFAIPRIHYVYLSRASSVVVPARDLARRGVSLALLKDPDMKVKGFLPFCGLTSAVASPDSYNVDPEMRLSQAQTTPAFLSWLQALAQCDELIAETAEAKTKLRDYLSQFNFFSPGPKAIIDVGWNGTIPSLLGDLFAEDSEFPLLHVLLLGRKSGLCDREPNPRVRIHSGLLLDDSAFLDRHNIPLDLPPLVELAANAPHGTTIGYERHGGQVRPILDAVKIGGIASQGALRKGWMDRCRALTLRRDFHGAVDPEAFRQGATASLFRLYRRPPRNVVRAISGCLFSMDWKSEARINLVGAGHGWKFYQRFFCGDVAHVVWFYGAARLFRIPLVAARTLSFLHRKS